jgi:ATP-dependent RNA helicase HelY
VNASEYLAGMAFPADRFQVEAAAAIDRGASVVVAAPTGSGKTVVAEAAIARALAGRTRAVYTTPIKALSNQKYGDFKARYGSERVGLLTGDNSINGDAAVVVMTTEVLRNMMYAGSPDLARVGVVILDEVHYLQDPSRGAVWEEIIIHLDRDIPLVCLSATIANAGEFSEWVGARRGDTALVVEEERPVPLDSTYLLKDRWEGGRLRLLDLFEGDLPNATLLRMLRRHPGRRRYGAPRRLEACELLRSRGLLPAIYFIFSRVGCSAAADQTASLGLRLTDAEEAAAIRETALARTAHLHRDDLAVLGFGRWLSNLERGIAPHHAGLVPAFKEATEELFAAGLVKVVFATETLALGINMPARTVVLESLSKFTGEAHELLTPGDYTQLTGRAGRRGIDGHGTAVVLHSGYVPIEEVAGIAAAAGHPLRSSFRPTYNMVVNMVASYPRPEAERLLNSSFAQFRDARRRTRLGENVAEAERRLAELRAEADCELGDVWTVVDEPAPSSDRVMAAFAATTAAGDVLEWTERSGTARFVVVARGHGPRPRLLLVAEDSRLRRISPERLPETAAVHGRIDLPTPVRPREATYRHRVADALRRWRPQGPPRRPEPETVEGARACPEYARHAAAVREARRVERRLQRDRRRLAAVSSGLLPRFRALRDLLESWAYLDDWSLTPAGERLRVIYSELDLLAAEALGAGAFDDLDVAEAAALVSAFTYEPRGGVEAGIWPTERVAERAERVWARWRELAEAEGAAGLPQTRPPEAGFASIAYRWAAGEGLEDLFGEEGEQVGDFVRNCRQLLDLLRQLSDVDPEARPVLQAAMTAIDRGVVAAVGVA